MAGTILEQGNAARKPQHDVNRLISGRWSPRALSGEPISDEEMLRLFEAARWAPSSYNHQPWRFIYAKRDTEHWDRLYGLMGEFNQSWTKNAALLMVIITQQNFEHNNEPNRTASFTGGAAMENLMLQAVDMGLVAHGMAGFDHERAKQELGVPDGYRVEAMLAVGRLGRTEELPTDLQGGEQPSNRKPVQDIIMEGLFRK